MSLICSAESEVSASASKEPGCEQSPSARLSLTAAPSSESTGPASHAMTMCEPSPLTALEQTELFPMSSVAASRAKTSAVPAAVLELMERAAGYGRITPDLLATFDRSTSSWRMSQHSLVEGLDEFSETWPRSGTMLSGIAYQLPPLALSTDATASGLWATPQSRDHFPPHTPEYVAAKKAQGHGMRNLNDEVMLFPTPTRVYTRADWTAEEIEARQSEVKAATLAKGKHHTGNGFGLNLAQAVNLWPTPNAGDFKAGMSNAPGRQQSSLPRSVGIAEGVSSGKRGGLNPTWVEWLMGFPLRWSELELSEMPLSRSSRKSSVRA